MNVRDSHNTGALGEVCKRVCDMVYSYYIRKVVAFCIHCVNVFWYVLLCQIGFGDFKWRLIFSCIASYCAKCVCVKETERVNAMFNDIYFWRPQFGACGK